MQLPNPMTVQQYIDFLGKAGPAAVARSGHGVHAKHTAFEREFGEAAADDNDIPKRLVYRRICPPVCEEANDNIHSRVS